MQSRKRSAPHDAWSIQAQLTLTANMYLAWPRACSTHASEPSAR